MKASIHPQYYPQARIICVCGATFTTGSTREEVHVQLCSNCHPFYTGQQRFVDSASLIDKFEKKRKEARLDSRKARQAKPEKEDTGPRTLKEMLMQIKHQK